MKSLVVCLSLPKTLSVEGSSVCFVVCLISDICNRDTLWASMNTIVPVFRLFGIDNIFVVLLNEEQIEHLGGLCSVVGKN